MTPVGHCLDSKQCDVRRMARAMKRANVQRAPKGPCIVRLHYYGCVYYLREFGQKRSPAPPVLEPGFTAKDYEADPSRLYYEAVLERNQATVFKPEKALALAKNWGGEVVEKK